MLPSTRTRVARLAACRSDLLDNGIDLDRRDPRERVAFVRRNLDYFRCVLGYEADLREVMAMIERHPGPSAIEGGR